MFLTRVMYRVCALALGVAPGEKRATLDLSACHDLLELTQDSEPRFIFELQFQATSYRIAACVCSALSVAPLLASGTTARGAAARHMHVRCPALRLNYFACWLQ